MTACAGPRQTPGTLRAAPSFFKRRINEKGVMLCCTLELTWELPAFWFI